MNKKKRSKEKRDVGRLVLYIEGELGGDIVGSIADEDGVLALFDLPSVGVLVEEREGLVAVSRQVRRLWRNL